MKHLSSNTKGENPFKIPESYFENNQKDFLDLVKKLEAEKQNQPKQAKVIPVYQKFILWGSAAAAAVVLTFVMLVPSLNPPVTNNQTEWLAEVTPDYVLAYMLEEDESVLDLSEEEWSLEILTDPTLDTQSEIEDEIIIDEIVDDLDIYDL